MKLKKGDIFDCEENIIVHQANCLGVMGSGIASQVKEKYPEVYKGYYHYCKTNTAEDILGTSLICQVNDKRYIANVFGQLAFGGDKVYTDYEALRHSLIEVRDFAKEHKLSVAIPCKIGCGLAGGDWNIVLDMIKEIFSDTETSIYEFNKKETYAKSK